MPKISVLMPVYNCELYIGEAIESVLNQTFSNFEFLIIDDASTDNTVGIIKEFNDSRIKLIEKPRNTGLTNSLNYGLKIAKGKYIARMDGDDISLPNRFEKQVVFLENNPNVIVCGTLFSIIGTDYIFSLPEHHKEIKVDLIFGNCIAHPSVMIRSNVFKIFSLSYDSFMEPAEDYALWVKLSNYGHLHNLQECLLKYRNHEGQVSNNRAITQRQIADNIRIDFLKTLGLDFYDVDKEILIKVFEKEDNLNVKEIVSFVEFKKKILEANSAGIFDTTVLETKMISFESRILNRYFLKREQFQPSIYWDYLYVKRKISNKYKTLVEFKLFVKSILFWKI